MGPPRRGGAGAGSGRARAAQYTGSAEPGGADRASTNGGRCRGSNRGKDAAGMHQESPRPPSLLRSFGFAWDGLAASVRGQRNMRIHLVAGILAGSFAAVAPLAGAERALVVLCTALVI